MSGSVRFRAILEPTGPVSTMIVVPEPILAALGRGRRVAVHATVNGHAYRTTVAPYAGRILLPFNAEGRAATGLSGGETVDVELRPDDAPRIVEPPDALAAALTMDPVAAAAWARLAPSSRREIVRAIEEAKRPETRARRVAGAVTRLRD
ncbi:MAG: YdeI/OmpD-associated family protein, partial [Chloroflexota bacterium]